jgi:hypothetical protein
VSVAEEAANGRLEGLRAMRDLLAKAMDAAEPQVQAQLAGQLAKAMEAIEIIESQKPEVSKSDDIARKLKAGLAGSEVVQLASRRRKSSAG